MNVCRRHGLLLAIAMLALGAASSLGMNGHVAPATPASAGEAFPESYFYIHRPTGKRYPEPATIEGKKMPALAVKDWIGEPPDLEKPAGKVVVVDFWATWCRPCVQSLPKNASLYKRYEPEGVLFIGVHDSRHGVDRMERLARSAGVTYPLCVDDGGASVRAWKVGFWPTYAVVDHEGIVRASGLRPEHVEDVIKALLAERDADAGSSDR